jgi:hypothetical protein
VDRLPKKPVAPSTKEETLKKLKDLPPRERLSVLMAVKAYREERHARRQLELQF